MAIVDKKTTKFQDRTASIKGNACAFQMASGLPARTSCTLTLDLSELEDTRAR